MEIIMKTKLFVLILGITMLFIWSCSEHSVTPFEQPLSNGRVVGAIHGVVTDFCTNTVFDSGAVKVSWVSNGVLKSTYTDQLGYYIITGLVSGEYVITFSGATDYAISQVTVRIPKLDQILISQPATDTDYHHSVTENIDLYKKNAGVKGKVYRRYNENLVTVASNVTVVVDYKASSVLMGDMDDYHYSFDSNVYPSKYTTTTDEFGFFEFEELPGAPMAIIYTLVYHDGTYEWFWEEGFDVVYLLQNSTYTYSDIFLQIVSPEPFLMQNNFDGVTNFELATDLFMTFSRAMNISTFTLEFGYLDDNMRVDVEIDTNWTGQTTLTINPFVDLVPGVEYRLKIRGESVDGYPFNENYKFTTVEGIEFMATNL